MNRKLGINVDCIPGGLVFERVKKIKEVGFDSIFASGFAFIGKIADTADSIGLNFEFLHAPFDGINNMWLEGDEYLKLFNRMKKSIDLASDNGIPTVIVHASSGWNPPAVTELGLSRFDSLVNYAKNKNVNIAIENLRRTDNVVLLGERYAAKGNVGYCYDIGHEHCYTDGVDWMELFRDRVICTHIHDNFGIKSKDQEGTDLHLLPFDGDVDYKSAMDRLNKYGYKGSLMLEVLNDRNPQYAAMDELEFLKLAYERAKKLSEL